MTDLIDVVQKQDPGSALIELYELEITDTDTVYFHTGLDADLTEIQFAGNTYIALPAELKGVEHNSDGSANRPEFTVANLLSVFADLLYDFWASPALQLRNEDLLGRSITKRTTLYKYLDGQPGESSPPIEFPTKRYILDRISSETKDAVTFELASPYDLAGITVPNRTIVGKYCGWQYQGGGSTSGCTWKSNSTILYRNGGGGVNSHKAYYTVDNEPIVPQGSSWAVTPVSYKEYTVWSGTGVAGSYYEHDNTVWKCVNNTTIPPRSNTRDWIRGDVCGKKLSSCKCRFQFVPEVESSSNQLPKHQSTLPVSQVLDTTKVLPFGAFPGARKFR